MFSKKMKLILMLFFIGSLAGCKGSSELTNISTAAEQTPAPTVPTIPTTTNPENSCVDKNIDNSHKGVVAINPRGTFSSVATVPGTNEYALAYVDTGSLTVQVSYWDGVSFSHEIVAGDHTATFVKIAFLSNKTPLIFWTNGSSHVKMASRSSAFGTSGTWTMGTLDSLATAGRAMEVAVSPLNEVGIVYLAGNTATTSAPRFIVCSENCSNPSNYTSMTLAAMNIESATAPTAAVIQQVQTGISWCQGVAGEYYPAVAYAATSAQTKYAICTQANLANCLVNTAWNKTLISVTGNVASSLYIDPTIVNDTPKVVSTVTGIKTFEGTVGCAAPGAWTPGSAVLPGTVATSGSVWLKLLKSKGATALDDRYHIIANEAAASARYYNTSSSAFNTLSSWNTVGILQTSTVLATGLTSAGMAILGNDELVATHYSSLTPQNLVVSTVRNYLQAANVATINLKYPNTNGNIQMIGITANSTTAARNISVSASSDGRPGVAYIDSSNGTHLTGRLKYAFRDSLVKDTTWKTIIVPHSGTGPMYPSLKFDHLNRPWISYYDYNSTVASSRFYLMMNPNTDGSGAWKVYQFPFVATAAAVALPATNDSALTMYYNNGVSYPVMAVIENNTVKAIKASRFNPNTETWSGTNAITVDTLTATTGAANLTIDSDSNGNIVLAWVDLAILTPFAGIEYSYSNGGLSWTPAKRIHSDSTTIRKIGQGLSIKINPFNGYPAMSYYDRAADKVFYSSCSDTPSNCSIGSWSTTEIESVAGVNGVTTYIGAAPASTRDQLLATSLTYDEEGNATVLYPLGNGSIIGASTGGHLKRVNISSAGVVTSEIFKNGVNASGSITNVNLAVAGHNVSSIQTEKGELVSVFIGPGNSLESRACGVE